jgi:outer membrane protein
MLKISISDDANTAIVKVEGKIAGPWIAELRKCWESLHSQAHARVLVDLTAVSFIEGSARELLRDMHRDGAALIAGVGLMTRQIVREIEEESRCTVSRPSLKPRHAAVIAIFVVLFLFEAARLNAQTGTAALPNTGTLRLTLRDAVGLALKQNPEVQVAALNLAQSQQDKNVALSALLPQAGAQLSESAQKYNTEAQLGIPLPLFPKSIGPYQVFDAGAGFSFPVFDLTLWRRWQAAGAVVSATDAVRMSAREQIVLLTVSQYLGCTRAAAAVSAAQSRVNLAQALYDQAADLQQNGVGTGLDTLRANVELQAEKQRLIVAQTQFKTATYGLARILNLDRRQQVEVAGQLDFEGDAAKLNEDELLSRAFIARPELRAIDARERAIARQKEAASESRLPTIAAEGFWGYQGLSAPSSIPAYQYQVSVRMPLFTGGRIHAETVKADLELKKVAQDRAALRDRIVMEVRSALAVVESARNEVDVANTAVRLANEEVVQARDRFQAGVANNIEVITAQDALSRANDNQIEALYRYNQARADLAHATGDMETMYAK